MDKLNFTPGTPGASGQPQQFNVNLIELDNFRCPHCNNQVFQPLLIIKKISAFQSSSGKAEVRPLQIFACTNCGAVPAEFGGLLLEKDDDTKAKDGEG